MLRFAVALLSVLSLVGADSRASPIHVGEILADSDLGRELLSKASRQLSQGGDDVFNGNWVSGYSLKFQGCHHISQWNDAINSEEDVRIATKRLVRFRMCPTDSCDKTTTGGCSQGYGDYVIDMNTYLQYYFAARETYKDFECSYLTDYVCQCNGNSNCLTKCFSQHNMLATCSGSGTGSDDAVIQMENYMTCTKSTYTDSGGDSLYVGPYCAHQGGEIHLGAFTDDACTNFADSANMGATAFAKASGYTLPYANANIVDLDCLSCKEPSNNNNDGNDAADSDKVAEVCESVYTLAGKCEANLPNGTVQYPNNNACNYMEGIKMARQDGAVITANAKANKTGVAFISMFTVAFVVLSGYVYYLKTKLDRASINLND
jgi:hypothetical protein